MLFIISHGRDKMSMQSIREVAFSDRFDASRFSLIYTDIGDWRMQWQVLLCRHKRDRLERYGRFKMRGAVVMCTTSGLTGYRLERISMAKDSVNIPVMPQILDVGDT